MDEVEWRCCDDPDAMLNFLRDSGKLSMRKARLFAALLCRRAWSLLTDERSRSAAEVVERAAEGQASSAELDAAEADAEAAYEEGRQAAEAAKEERRRLAAGGVSQVTPGEVYAARSCLVNRNSL